jgi:simple sugar transport system permease protein
VVVTIMLNSLAGFVIIGLVNDVFKITGPTFARTADVGNAALPVLFGRDGSLGILIALAVVPIAYLLIYRTTLGFEIRTVGENPSAARYAGMSPRSLIILTMSLCGLFAGLAGTIEILDLGYYPAVFGTAIGFTGITVALLGRSHPVGILLAAILLGGMEAGAPAMQITAKIPKEIIDVIQGLILLFLAAEVLIRRVFRIRAERATPDELSTVTASYGSGQAA